MDTNKILLPILNKISRLNLIKSLEFIHYDIQFFFGNGHATNGNVIGNDHVPPYIVDFLISNIIKYSSVSGKNSLFDSDIRNSICKPLSELQGQVNLPLIKEDVNAFLYRFFQNQAKLQKQSDPRVAFYRYYSVYNTPQANDYFENKNGVSLDSFFRWSIFCYVGFAYNNTFSYNLQSFYPPFLDEDGKKSLDFVLKHISLPYIELKRLYSTYHYSNNEDMFIFDPQAPHVKYPIFKFGNRLYCTNPIYIMHALLEGFYYIFDFPKSEASIKSLVANSFENYIGMLLGHFLNGTTITYKKELSYSYKKQQKKTSDWIIWNDQEIAFIDCKLKHMSMKSKASAYIDENIVNDIIRGHEFSRKFIHDHIETLPTGITKDILDLGIGVGKILVSYNDYSKDAIRELPYMEGRKFHAILLTLEESFTGQYKNKIIEIAKSYYYYKTNQSIDINPNTIRIISAKTIEEDLNYVRITGRIDMIGNSPKTNMNLDPFLTKKFKKELVEPLIATFPKD